VLEWTGYGHDDPLASQEAVLAEASRVLKWGGTLLIGIENRFGAHYFLGAFRHALLQLLVRTSEFLFHALALEKFRYHR